MTTVSSTARTAREASVGADEMLYEVLRALQRVAVAQVVPEGLDADDETDAREEFSGIALHGARRLAATLDGVSLVGHLESPAAEGPSAERPLYWEFPAYGGQQAVREGRSSLLTAEEHRQVLSTALAAQISGREDRVVTGLGRPAAVIEEDTTLRRADVVGHPPTRSRSGDDGTATGPPCRPVLAPGWPVEGQGWPGRRGPAA